MLFVTHRYVNLSALTKEASLCRKQATTESHNWLKYRKQANKQIPKQWLVMRCPAPSTTQLLHLQFRDHYRRGNKNIFQRARKSAVRSQSLRNDREAVPMIMQ